MFDGTVADNIRFGRPDATDEEIRSAATAVGADTFIDALPDGYDTDVAKRGGRLSAGQRQLVAFARAFLANPAVLILDEATSSLDIPSERLVQRRLQTVLADRTALVIAHRLSTVQIADRVLVVEDGRVVEDGPPDELIARRRPLRGTAPRVAAVFGLARTVTPPRLCTDRDFAPERDLTARRTQGCFANAGATQRVSISRSVRGSGAGQNNIDNSTRTIHGPISGSSSVSPVSSVAKAAIAGDAVSQVFPRPRTESSKSSRAGSARTRSTASMIAVSTRSGPESPATARRTCSTMRPPARAVTSSRMSALPPTWR